jgi:hypothetical protein
MKTTLDLPRPLLLRLASRAMREGTSLSRYVTRLLERSPSPRSAATHPGRIDEADDLFEALRDELGL